MTNNQGAPLGCLHEQGLVRGAAFFRCSLKRVQAMLIL